MSVSKGFAGVGCRFGDRPVLSSRRADKKSTQAATMGEGEAIYVHPKGVHKSMSSNLCPARSGHEEGRS